MQKKNNVEWKESICESLDIIAEYYDVSVREMMKFLLAIVVESAILYSMSQKEFKKMMESSYQAFIACREEEDGNG